MAEIPHVPYILKESPLYSTFSRVGIDDGNGKRRSGFRYHFNVKVSLTLILNVS